MENKLINVEAGETRIWERPEKSGIYLLSEFIDNSKSSYEEMISNGQNNEMPIELTFDKKNGYISVVDEGLGFEIIQAIRTIGNNKIQYGQTNQYYVGMKSAMNFFGDFSILVSERMVNGVNQRFANFFIYRNGCLEADVELESKNQTGSEVYLFTDYQAAKQFWKESLNFKNYNDLHKFPREEDLNKSEWLTYSKTETLLDNIDSNYPYLTASLFQRYTPLVNTYSNIKINFRCFDGNGYSRLLDNDNKIKPIEKGVQFTPEYFKVIQKNNFNQEISLTFDKLNDDSLKLFNSYLKENNQGFKKNLESLLYNDMNQHFTKIKSYERDRGKVSSNESGDYLGLFNFEWIDYPEKANKFEFANKENNWAKWPFVRAFVKIFLSNLYDQQGSLANIKFRIKNLTIYDDQVVVAARESSDEKFKLDFNLNIYSTKFTKKGGIYGNTPMKWISGLTLTQNNRAIYHGPNVDRSNISRQLDVLTPFPERILTNEFEQSDPSAFPNFYSNKNNPTGIVIGGNTERWPSRIFGDVIIPDSSLFSSGTNKALINNITPLQDFIMDILKDSGINVLVRWVYLLDNDGFKGSETLKDSILMNNSHNKLEKEHNLGKTLAEILKNMRKIEEPEGSEGLNSDADGIIEQPTGINTPIYEPIITTGEQNNYLSPGFDDDTKIIKNYEGLFRSVKNNPWSLLKIHNVNLDSDNLTIQLNTSDKTFSKWNHQLNLMFDKNRDDNEIKLVLRDDEPIQLSIPLDAKRWNMDDLVKQSEKVTKNISSALIQVSNYYSIATNKKLSKKADEKHINKVVEKFLINKLGNMNLKNGQD